MPQLSGNYFCPLVTFQFPAAYFRHGLSPNAHSTRSCLFWSHFSAWSFSLIRCLTLSGNATRLILYVMRKNLLSAHDCHISDNMLSGPIVCAVHLVRPSSHIDMMRTVPVSGDSNDTVFCRTPQSACHQRSIAIVQISIQVADSTSFQEPVVGLVLVFLLRCPFFTSEL